ncbi:hypothetical protein HHK36_010306 [Tetracentron sinense]|uniref:Signal peptidase complex catalytic subunit SEC11 n=1 Tax=Tetracentron sinense TaxID=13715 RepID=A0A834ZEQ9_TETSI|nr:hypothetical protein HHK36_010306 [Tetracentron sinense]
MDFLRKAAESIRSIAIRRITTQAINLGTVMTFALMIWKLWICLSGSDSPVVVVLTGSMEPGFKRGRDIPIVHRVITVHEHRDLGEINILTKGDSNLVDDRNGIYADGQLWLQQYHIIGRVSGFLPYAGWATIIMTEKPVIKYLLIGALSLLVITTKE